MKVLNLHCDDGHAFEGWFASESDYDSQSERGLLDCPVCSSKAVSKGLPAPRLNFGAMELTQQKPPMEPAVLPSSHQVQAMLLKMAREIAAQTEDVGERFEEEARRIHYNETPERGIRGVASRADARELLEEGIGVLPLPFAHLLGNLQ